LIREGVVVDENDEEEDSNIGAVAEGATRGCESAG